MERLVAANRRIVGWLRVGAPVVIAGSLIVLFWVFGADYLDLPPTLLPPPGDVVAALVTNINRVLQDLAITLIEIAWGLLAGVIVGASIGITAAKSRWVASTVYPLILVTQTVPKLALAPLLIIWLGTGLSSRVAVVALVAFFPVVVATAEGFSGVDPYLIMLCRSIGLAPGARFFKVELPAAAPSIFGGLKVGATFAVVGAVVAEFIGGSGGLGRLALAASSRLQTALLLAALAVLAMVGLLLYGMIATAERVAIPWYFERSDRGDEMIGIL